MRADSVARRAPPRGAALIEAIVAMAILSVGGLGVIAALHESLRSEASLRKREETTLNASRVLSAMVLLTRTDLERRVGSHAVGEFLVEVQRPQPTLFRIGIAEREAPSVETLVTVVFRPEASAP